VPTDERPVLLAELLHIEAELRRRAGERPEAEEYLHRFPGQETVVQAVLGFVTRTSPESPQAAAPPPGPPAVPGYEILGELGRGGMGVVYKARHEPLKRIVALKFIRTGTHTSAVHQERFRREAEVVARLRHPNIIQIYDIGEHGGQVFLAL